MEISIAALLRLMEWSREEAKTDTDLHKMVDRLSVFNKIDSEVIEEILK